MIFLPYLIADFTYLDAEKGLFYRTSLQILPYLIADFTYLDAEIYSEK